MDIKLTPPAYAPIRVLTEMEIHRGIASADLVEYKPWSEATFPSGHWLVNFWLLDNTKNN